jgi:hypothetical protein
MTKEAYSPGSLVIHSKNKLIGTVILEIEDMVYVRVSEGKPVQEWKKDDLDLWDQRAEIERQLKKGGYIRDIYKKSEDDLKF